jgi:hypothetical protein
MSGRRNEVQKTGKFFPGLPLSDIGRLGTVKSEVARLTRVQARDAQSDHPTFVLPDTGCVGNIRIVQRGMIAKLSLFALLQTDSFKYIFVQKDEMRATVPCRGLRT